MSYGAFVHCRCFQDDKIPTPYFADFIKYDECGLYIYLPKELENNQEKSQDIFIDFYDWVEIACTHRNMYLSNQDVANIPTMNKFKNFIKTYKDDYPILYQYLPTVNEDIIPPKLAEPPLKELCKLENVPERQRDFDCILQSLTQLAKASIETGNPIHWSLINAIKPHPIINPYQYPFNPFI